MSKKIMTMVLTMEQLVEFCKSHQLYSFSSAETGYQIAVTVPATYSVSEDDDPAHRGLMRLRIKVCHTGRNRNGSYISEEAMRNAMPSLKNRPLLAYIHQLDDGSWDFGSHNIELSKDGKEVIYLEKQVGNFTEDDPVLEHDDEADKDYVIAYAVVSEEYTKAAGIIREKGGSKNSCELYVDKFAYNAKENYLDIQEFYFNGSTLLGKRNDGTEVGEGMLGSRADIASFAVGNGDKTPSHTENFKEGGQNVTKIDELLAKYGKTLEEITFEHEGLTDEELEAKFAEAFDDTSSTGEGDPADGGEDPAEGGEGGNEGEDPAEGEEPDTSTDLGKLKKVASALEQYELSMTDVQRALYTLVNDTYASDDNAWYFLTVYSNTLVMVDYFTDTAYRQGYTQDGDTFSLTGERVRVYANWLTKEEETAVEDLRKENAELKEFKKAAEQMAEQRGDKLALLNSDRYSAIHGEDAYKNLVKNVDSYSLADIEKEAKVVLFDYKEAHPTETNKVNLELNVKPVKKAYGTLFD